MLMKELLLSQVLILFSQQCLKGECVNFYQCVDVPSRMPLKLALTKPRSGEKNSDREFLEVLESGTTLALQKHNRSLRAYVL